MKKLRLLLYWKITISIYTVTLCLIDRCKKNYQRLSLLFVYTIGQNLHGIFGYFLVILIVRYQTVILLIVILQITRATAHYFWLASPRLRVSRTLAINITPKYVCLLWCQWSVVYNIDSLFKIVLK